MNVVILTEGGKDFGFGHVSRCSSIYQAFLKFNISPKFIINGDGSIKSVLGDIPFKIFNWKENISFLNSSDIVIIDSYIAEMEDYSAIAKKVALSIYFDDNNRLVYPNGIVVNGLINASSLDYPQNGGISYLLGSSFTPLRVNFTESSKLIINDKINNILITTGGNDLRNLTPKILELLNSNFPNIYKKVIITDSFDNISEIKSLKNEHVEIIHSPNVEKMLQTMLGVDLAISASGQTLYELACVGVPTIAIGIIDNQKNNIENWNKIGFIEFAGWWNDKDLFNNILEKIDFLNDKNTRIDKKLIGIQMIDGKGSIRIVKSILNEYYKKYSIFREIKEEDCFKIFEIANDDEVRKSSFNSEKIQLENHKKWFKNILNDNSVKFYVLEYNDDLIGQLRLDFNQEDPVISISLNKKYRGLGLSKILLSKGLELIDGKVIAFIKKDNLRSISFFESMGFKKVCEVIINNCCALKFIKE